MSTFPPEKAVRFLKTTAGKWTLAGLVGTFVLGYFVGREHIKAELRAHFAEAIGGLEEAFGTQNDALAQKKIVKDDADPIGILVEKKEFVPSDFSANRYSDRIEFVFQFQNTMQKDIRAFVGTVTFSDLFDREIYSISLTNEDGLAAGETKAWEGGIDYNQFMDSHQRLAAVNLKDAKITFTTEQVLYVDGTKDEF